MTYHLAYFCSVVLMVQVALERFASVIIDVAELGVMTSKNFIQFMVVVRG